jgi:hypothetical protein
MNDTDDFFDKQTVRQALAALKDTLHLSSEVIVAYASGILSSDGASKVRSHLAACKECSAILNVAEKALRTEKVSEFHESETKSPVIPRKVTAKVKLACFVNSKSDEITVRLARLFLAEEMWPSIRPILAVVRRWRQDRVEEHEEGGKKLSVAAFASGTSPRAKENIDSILKTVNFVDIVCQLLIERSDSLHELGQELPGCVDEAMDTLGKLPPDDTMKTQMLTCITEIFRKTHHGPNQT